MRAGKERCAVLHGTEEAAASTKLTADISQCRQVAFNHANAAGTEYVPIFRVPNPRAGCPSLRCRSTPESALPVACTRKGTGWREVHGTVAAQRDAQQPVSHPIDVAASISSRARGSLPVMAAARSLARATFSIKQPTL